MAQVQNQNQFRITPIVGAQDLTVNQNIKACRINPDSVSTDPIVAGQAVKLVDVAGDVPIVDVAAVTEEAYGVLVHDLRHDTFAKGDYVNVAARGSVIFLEASAAIAGGAAVQNTPGGPTVQTLTSLATNCRLGRNLTKIAAAGVVRVEIDPADANQSAY